MCNCIELSTKALDETGRNTALNVPISVDFKNGKLCTPRLTVGVVKKDESKREKPTLIFATYCPFCGEKYQEEG